MTEVTAVESDAFVFFGATGDLAFRQVFPALQALIRRGHFEMPIIGVAKSATDLDALRARAHESLEQHGGVDPRAFAALAAHLHYVNGDYHDAETFRQLRTAFGGACRPLYYFVIPPELFATVAEGLAGADTHHGARVVVEKPFSRDEEAGAIRDVVQNHLLETGALLTMEAPVGRHPDALRDEQQRAFRAMRPLSPADVVRGHFCGYRSEDGVAADSCVETFAAVRLSVDTPRWAGVPFYIRAGKRMPLTATEVRVEFKPRTQAIFDTASARQGDYVRFRISPNVTISLGARVKKPAEADQIIVADGGWHDPTPVAPSARGMTP